SAPACRRHARGRVRRQRSLRHLPHGAAGGDPHPRQPRSLRSCVRARPRGGARWADRLSRGRCIAFVLNRLALAQGLHAPFVAVAALVVFAVTQTLHASGFLAVYLAGLVVGNRPTRGHSSIIAFLDAITWLAQIVMFVLLGLLAWPYRVPSTILPGLVVAITMMFIARPAAVFLCLWPFSFRKSEKLFISWVGLRGAVGIFLASIPLLVGLPK